MNRTLSKFVALLSIFLTAFVAESAELETETFAAFESETTQDLLLFYDLEEIINTKTAIASKIEETTSDAPSSVTVFTQTDIRNMGISTIEELLNHVPGFQADRELRFNQGYRVTARGVDSGQESNNILFMIDGQRLNDDLSGGALSINRFLTTANVERVEIIRGPGSALYGTSAFTGVVNIITTSDMKNAFVSAGDLNSREYYFNLNQQVNKWKVSLFGRHYEDDGETYGPEVVEPLIREPSLIVNSIRDPKSIDDIYVKLSWDDRVQVIYRHHQPTMRDFISNIFVANDTNFTKNESEFIRLSYTPVSTEIWEVDLHGSYTENAEYRQTQAMTIAPGETQLFLTGRRTREEEFSLGLNTSYRGLKDHELLAGVIFRKPDVKRSQEISNIDTGGGEVIDIGENVREGSRDIAGIYIQDKYHIIPHLDLTAGVRHDDYSDFGSTTNPRAALVYSLSSSSTFKFLYGEAFRAPSARQISSIAFGNPDLKPEKIRTIEFAWIQEFPVAHTTVTYFQNTIEDKIDTVFVPGKIPPVEAANLPDVTTEGIELEALVEITQELFLRAAYTHLFEIEEDPRDVAEQTFSFALNYQHDLFNLNLNGYYHGTTEKIIRVARQTENSKIDDYWLLNTTLIIPFSPKIHVVGKIENILDEDYYTSTATVDLPEGAPNRGRTYSVGLNMSF